jgi:hypothetical protein
MHFGTLTALGDQPEDEGRYVCPAAERNGRGTLAAGRVDLDLSQAQWVVLR